MTLFISDTDNRRRTIGKYGFAYLFITLFCVLFGGVYEYFSHDVYSYFMLYAFAYPLVGGVLPFFAIAFTQVRLPSRLAINLYNCGIATLTVGSIVRGILEIYGTTNSLIKFYPFVGAVFLIFAIIVYLFNIKRKSK